MSNRILRYLHSLIQAHDAKSVIPHPMDCNVCGDPGLHPVLIDKRAEWRCDICYPPFLRKDGTRAAIPSLAGDPGR